MDTTGFAILAPVPLEHLISGLEIAETQPFVAYGTRKWDTLRKVDELREGLRVPVLIYPSHEDAIASDALTVSWIAWYIGHVDSKNGAHPSGSTYRPETTFKYPTDNKGYWAAFWHVEGLRRLPKDRQFTIGKVQGLKGGWRKDAPPRGPELVTFPSFLDDLEG